MNNTNIIIGNVLSGIAAIFTVLSTTSHSRKNIYGFQVIQCVIMGIGSIFFFSYSGIITYILCALRNYLLAYDKFTKKACGVIIVVLTVVGIMANNRGLLGYMPIIATVIYTLGGYIFKKEITIKINVLVDLILWAIYDVFIFDYVSCVMDTVSVVTGVVSIVVLLRKTKNNKEKEIKSLQK